MIEMMFTCFQITLKTIFLKGKIGRTEENRKITQNNNSFENPFFELSQLGCKNNGSTVWPSYLNLNDPTGSSVGISII